MTYYEFRTRWYELSCFSIRQVYAWQPGFDRNNLFRWTKSGLLIRLRQGYFTFPEYKELRDYTLFFANRIYRPSYVSLYTALSFYGMIPEAIVQITSISSRKTISFTNPIGEYTYKTIQPRLMFGYSIKPISDSAVIHIAEPEKALLDLLYLYPEYDTPQALEDLRLDEDYLHDEMKTSLLKEYAQRFQVKALENRVNQLLKTYGL